MPTLGDMALTVPSVSLARWVSIAFPAVADALGGRGSVLASYVLIISLSTAVISLVLPVAVFMEHGVFHQATSLGGAVADGLLLGLLYAATGRAFIQCLLWAPLLVLYTYWRRSLTRTHSMDLLQLLYSVQLVLGVVRLFLTST